MPSKPVRIIFLSELELTCRAETCDKYNEYIVFKISEFSVFVIDKRHLNEQKSVAGSICYLKDEKEERK